MKFFLLTALVFSSLAYSQVKYVEVKYDGVIEGHEEVVEGEEHDHHENECSIKVRFPLDFGKIKNFEALVTITVPNEDDHGDDDGDHDDHDDHHDHDHDHEHNQADFIRKVRLAEKEEPKVITKTFTIKPHSTVSNMFSGKAGEGRKVERFNLLYNIGENDTMIFTMFTADLWVEDHGHHHNVVCTNLE